MPASPLTATRTIKELKWFWPGTRFQLKETEGLCAVWRDNEPRACFSGQSWEEVMRQAIREGWKDKE